jgi:hypothetical protein
MFLTYFAVGIRIIIGMVFLACFHYLAAMFENTSTAFVYAAKQFLINVELQRIFK